MRIEINAGGLGGSLAISDFQSDMSKFITNVDNVISSFKTVKNEIYDVNGGTNNLQEALDNVEARINLEKTRKEAAQKVQKKADDFLDLVVRIDKKVAEEVNKNKEAFYKTNPWLRPPTSVDPDKVWYEQAWDWLCGTAKEIAKDIKAAWEWTKDTLKKAWDGLVAFYNTNIGKIVLGIVAIVIGAIVCVAIGATSLAALGSMILLGLKSTIVSAAISAGFAATVTLANSIILKKNTDETIKDVLISAWDGFAGGFFWGGLFSGGAFVLSGGMKYLFNKHQLPKSGHQVGPFKFFSPDNPQRYAQPGGTLFKYKNFHIDVRAPFDLAKPAEWKTIIHYHLFGGNDHIPINWILGLVLGEEYAKKN